MQILFLVLSTIFAVMAVISLMHSDKNRAMWGFGLAMNVNTIVDVLIKMAK